MDFFRLKTLTSHTDAHAVRDRPSLKYGKRQFRPGSFHELQDNSNESQTNSNEAKNASDNAEMMVHVDESFNFQTSGNSYVNFDLISLLGLTLPTETNDIPENLKKKIIRVKASRPLVVNKTGMYFPEIDVTFIGDHARQFPGRKPGSEKESIR